MNPQHLSGDDAWMTPQHVIDRATRVLGGIELDPASSEKGNARIQAEEYFDEEDDALSQVQWGFPKYPVSIFCNPPGGLFPKGHPKRGKLSKTQAFWVKLMTEIKAGHVSHAIFLFFSISGLQNCQDLGVPAPTDYVICIPKDRLKFVPSSPNVKESTPSHANAIVYVPGTVDRGDIFFREFEEIGAILMNAEAWT